MDDADPRSELPFVDEHTVVVAAPASVVWDGLGEWLRRQARTSVPLARVLGTVPANAAGDPLRAGSAIPGFAVREAVPRERVVLAGRHRFSRYHLTFVLVPDGGRTRLSARSEAAFPGLHGAAYRALVIGSGAHRLLVRRLLRSIKQAAEADG